MNAQKFCKTMNQCPDSDPRPLVVHMGGAARLGNYTHIRFNDDSVAIGINGMDGEPVWIPLPSRSAQIEIDVCGPPAEEAREMLVSLDAQISEAARLIRIGHDYLAMSPEWHEAASAWLRIAEADRE